jgi:hypothetical protein
MTAGDSNVLLAWATVVGPVVGAGIGWILNERSERVRLKRSEAAARFAVARGLMRNRGTPDWIASMNEIPLYFSKDVEIMRMWRALAYSTSVNRGQDQARLVLAVIRAVGITSDLEQDDVDKFLTWAGQNGSSSGAVISPAAGASPS